MSKSLNFVSALSVTKFMIIMASFKGNMLNISAQQIVTNLQFANLVILYHASGSFILVKCTAQLPVKLPMTAAVAAFALSIFGDVTQLELG